MWFLFLEWALSGFLAFSDSPSSPLSTSLEETEKIPFEVCFKASGLFVSLSIPTLLELLLSETNLAVGDLSPI